MSSTMHELIKALRYELEKKKGEQYLLRSYLKDNRMKLRGFRTKRLNLEKAREIVKEVGLKTQEQLQYHISDITSLALEAVFNDPYKLTAEFVQRRNKTECDLYFERDGDKIDPLSASGGGTVDVASFALRIASWSMESPQSRPTIILDEPLRFLSADRQEKASEMLKEISTKLGIQFIIITHESTLTPFADRIFETKIRKGITAIKTN